MRMINADALIEKLEAWKKEAERRDATINYTFASAIIAQVNAEPTVEERKRGEWIWDDEGYHCSECFFHAYGNTLECLEGAYKFCPNCGADLRQGGIG